MLTFLSGPAWPLDTFEAQPVGAVTDTETMQINAKIELYLKLDVSVKVGDWSFLFTRWTQREERNNLKKQQKYSVFDGKIRVRDPLTG